MKKALWAVLGVVTSLAAGVLGAILLAPRSGRETRALIRERADDLRNKAVDGVQHTMRRGRMRVTDFVQSGQDTAEQVFEKTRSARELGERKIGELTEQAKKRAQTLNKQGVQRIDLAKDRLDAARHKLQETDIIE